MKLLLLFLLSAFLLAQTACGDSAPSRKHVRTKRPVTEKATTPVIKKDAGVHTDASAPETEKTVRFTGKIMASNAYCGGAYPNDEMLEELKQEFVYDRKPLRLIPIGKGKVVSFTTNRSGFFSVKIVPGCYRLCPGPRPESTADGYNPNCSLWMEHVFEELVIPDKSSYVRNLRIEIPCDPCNPWIRTRP